MHNLFMYEIKLKFVRLLFNLQWRGSPALHTRLEGRLIAVHVLCSASTSTRLVASCATFRVAGASHNGVLGMASNI